MHHFIDGSGNMLDRNHFYENHGESNLVPIKKEYGDSEGIEETKCFMNEFIAEDEKIRIKYETSEEPKIEDSYEENTVKIEVEASEEENISNMPEAIDAKEKIWHDSNRNYGEKETKCFMNEFISGDEKIRIKYETSEEPKIKNSYEENTVKIEVEASEEENISNMPEAIDAKEKI
ncbi:hypothetical protein HHI36_022682 [Cryptolaemus montrouzieri]|uniref:Uncharacterized protein n=1 Tax=Cryptolaemus montrouzieri TaxID=559131 RepID=A0ABD2N0L4_9CUCU